MGRLVVREERQRVRGWRLMGRFCYDSTNQGVMHGRVLMSVWEGMIPRSELFELPTDCFIEVFSILLLL
jgi:hypothetical protein